MRLEQKASPQPRFQHERIAAASPLLKARFAAVDEAFVASAPYQITDGFLKKSDPDAVAALREFLKETGVHDYDSQQLGAEEFGVLLPMEYLRLDADGAVSATTVTLSLYKPANGKRNDRRFNILGLGKKDRYADGDFVVFGFSETNELLLLNVSEGLGKLPLESARWDRLLESGCSMMRISESFEPEAIPVEDVLPGANLTPIVRTGQSFMRDAALRAKIERHAVDVAIGFYESRGADEIHELGKPYDLRVKMGEVEIHVEVKGSRNTVDAVFVTRNEVKEALKYRRTELFVVDQIKFHSFDQGVWILEGGRVRHWENWKPSDESLTALQYSHALSVPDLLLMEADRLPAFTVLANE